MHYVQRQRVDELRQGLRQSRRASFKALIEPLRVESLRRLLACLELPVAGTRDVLIERLLAAVEDWELICEPELDEEWRPETLALESLTKPNLHRIAKHLNVPVSGATRVDDLRDALAAAPSVTFEAILESLTREGLRKLCDVFEVPRPRTVGELRARLFEAQAEWYDDLKSDGNGSEVELLTGEFRSFAHLVNREFVFHPEEQGERRKYQEAAVRKLRRKLDADQPILLHVASGGGKTWIANDTVVRWRRSHPVTPVLWVTKDWRLLWQAARDLTRRHKGMYDQVARIGGAGGPLGPLPRATRHASVVYTTIQTLASRISRRKLRSFKPSLVVWDECHWGQGGASGRRVVRWCMHRKIPLLGLTATPRPPEHSIYEVVFRRGFSELVEEGFLSSPVPLEPVRTGVHWRPDRLRDGDFRQDSLRVLALDERRNRLIVDHFAQNQRRYGQTIVFACTMEHADLLATSFKLRKGVAARPIHSNQAERVNQRYLEQFKHGEVKVLVNVAMLTHGVDVPEARTVFLCRPTLSDVLFSQMVGRAARRVRGKDRFFIVEFTDNLERHGEHLRTAREFFKGTGWDRTKSSRPSKPYSYTRRHCFDLRGAPTFIPDDEGIDKAIRGLWYRSGQTFGLEFELTNPEFVFDQPPDEDWETRAEGLLECLRKSLPEGTVAPTPYPEYHAEGRNDEVWNVEWDRTCGWEVTSRILQDQRGFEEVVMACEGLRRGAEAQGLKVDFMTGTHVHIGWMGRTVREVRRAIELTRLFEPGLASLVAPSRLTTFDGSFYDTSKPNQFCRPVSAVFSSKALTRATTTERIWELSERRRARHLTFNVRPIDEIQTVEVRLHNGTLEAPKILLWLSLWQQMLWCATSPRKIPSVPDVAILRPKGNIVELAKRFLPAGEDQAFLARLEARRQEVARLWKRHPELSHWLPYKRKWNGK